MGDAATEFFGQENQFNTSLGGIFGSFAVQLVKADVQAKQANVGFLEALLVDPKGNPRPNVTAKMAFQFGEGEDGKAEFDIDEPLFVLADLTAFLPQVATLDMEMNTDSHAEDASSLKGSQSISGTGSVGWGPFKVSVTISGSMAESKESRRSSDQRSKTSAHLEMGRSPTPEGVARLNDTLTALGDIAKMIVKARVRDKAQEVAQKEGLTPSAGESTGGGATPADQGGGAGGGSQG